MINFNFTAEEYKDKYENMLYNHDKHVLKEILFKVSTLLKDNEIKKVKWSVYALEKDKVTLFSQPEIYFSYTKYPGKWFKNRLGNTIKEVHEKNTPIQDLFFSVVKTLNFEKNSDCIIYELEILSGLFNWSNHFVNIDFFDKSDYWKKKRVEDGQDFLYVELDSQNYVDAILDLIGDYMFKVETKKDLLEFNLLEKNSMVKKLNKI